MIKVRAAGAMDARNMADLLNEIIRIGGTTAFTEEITADTILKWMAATPERAVWNVAEDEAGTLLGFQYVRPNEALSPDACSIATFARAGKAGLGIGTKLFDKTSQGARDIGYVWIDATIRADNESGLTYYQSRGFEDYARHKDIVLGNGLIVDKISKRYDLS